MISVRNHNQTISNIINELKREAFRDGVNPDQIKDVVRESVKGLDKKEIEAVLDSLELHMKSTGDVRFRDVFGVPKQDLLAQLIAEARGPGGNAALGFFSAHDDFSAKAAVETANEAIRKIHSRLTEELRTEDA
ncbi:MAG: hypothetical protein JXR83_06510, partial [Deltaproteobacteria bacterium]|nr:hypothetical protein [Deltaproteobacteria bacterium]